MDREMTAHLLSEVVEQVHKEKHESILVLVDIHSDHDLVWGVDLLPGALPS